MFGVGRSLKRKLGRSLQPVTPISAPADAAPLPEWVNPFDASQRIDQAVIAGARISYPRGDKMFAHLARGAPYEPWVFAHLHKHFTKDAVFVDVGANIGFFSAVASRVVKRVIAIEPYPPNVVLLQKNLTENGRDNFVIFPVAASNRLETAGIDLAPGTNHSVRGISAGRPLPVMGIPLDAILRDEAPTIIKIDVEGHEYSAITGMRATIERHRPVITIEYSPKFINAASGIEGSELLQFMTERGYKIANMGRDNKLMPDQTLDDIQRLWTSGPTRTHLDLLLTPA